MGEWGGDGSFLDLIKELGVVVVVMFLYWFVWGRKRMYGKVAGNLLMCYLVIERMIKRGGSGVG